MHLIRTIVLAPALVLAALAAPRATSAAAIIDLSPDQLTKGPGTDSWTWTFAVPTIMAANDTLQLDFAFERGVLRLGDSGAAPDAAQQNYRSSLIARLGSQQAALAKARSDLTQVADNLAVKQAKKATLAAQAQQNQTSINQVAAELGVLAQTKSTLVATLDSLGDAIEVANAEVVKAGNAVADFIDKFGEVVGGILDGLRDTFNEAVGTLNGLLAQQQETTQKLVTNTQAQNQKLQQQNLLTIEAANLQSEIGTTDQQIAQLETQKDETEMLASRLATLISVTNQELAQLPVDKGAEGVLVTLNGPLGEPVPLFGQLLLNLAGGDPANIGPFFQGEFEGDGSTLFRAFADITPSYVDIEGLTLVLDLYGRPGEPFVLSSITIELQADEIGIPVPEPGTVGMLGLGLLALASGRRRHSS